MAGELLTKNDFQQFIKNLDDHFDLKLGSFIVPIVLYCVSFPYIIKNNASEYIAWVLLFFLNITFPFTYLNELYSLGRKVTKKGAPGYVVVFSICAITAAYALQFVVLLFVIMKNESIRKGKEKKGDYDNEGNQDLDTKDWSVEFRDKNISILFITGTALSWAMVINHFSYDLKLNYFDPEKKDANNKVIPQLTQMEEKFPVGSRIQWFVHLIPKTLSTLDESWHDIVDNIPLGPLAKSSAIYCVSLITIIFSVFIRFKYARKNLKTMGSDGYISEEVRIVQRKGHTLANIGPLFGKTFQNHVRNIRRLAIVSIVFFIIMAGGMLGYLGKSFIASNTTSKFRFEHGFVIWAVLCCAALFPAFFADKKSKSNKIKNKIFPMHDAIYFQRKMDNLSDFSSNEINVYYSPNELYAGELILNPSSRSSPIQQVIAELGYYFKKHLFANDSIDVLAQSESGAVDIYGNYINVQKSFELLEKKLQNINGYDVSVPKLKEKDYKRFKTEFKSIMEQIYMKKHAEFESDRTEYAEANPGMEYPFVFEESETFKDKKKLYETEQHNLPLKRYIFFLVCLLFGFLCSSVIISAINLTPEIDLTPIDLSEKTIFYTAFIVVMIFATLIMFGIGLGLEFISPEKDKEMKTFLAVVFSMIGASFFALSTRFNMLSYLWKTSGTILNVFLKTLGPVAIVLFASLSISYSFKNYKRFKYITSE